MRYLVAMGKGVFIPVGIGPETKYVGFGRRNLGVGVASRLRTGVIVGTGVDRKTCKVAARSFGLPVAGISMISW